MSFNCSKVGGTERDVGNREGRVGGKFPTKAAWGRLGDGEGGGGRDRGGGGGGRRGGKRRGIGINLEPRDVTLKRRNLEREGMRVVNFQSKRKINPHWHPSEGKHGRNS